MWSQECECKLFKTITGWLLDQSFAGQNHKSNHTQITQGLAKPNLNQGGMTWGDTTFKTGPDVFIAKHALMKEVCACILPNH